MGYFKGFAVTGRQILKPKVTAPEGAAPPACNREAVYVPG